MTGTAGPILQSLTVLFGNIDYLAVFQLISSTYTLSATAAAALVIGRRVFFYLTTFLHDDFHVFLAWILHYGRDCRKKNKTL